MFEELREHFLSMADLPVEEIHVWFVDGNGVVANHWVAAEGGRSGASVSLRELFRMAWVHSAEAIVIAHNHPNGDATHSFEDDEFTARVREQGEICEAVLLDHFVVGGDTVYSFTEDRYFQIETAQLAHAIAD